MTTTTKHDKGMLFFLFALLVLFLWWGCEALFQLMYSPSQWHDYLFQGVMSFGEVLILGSMLIAPYRPVLQKVGLIFAYLLLLAWYLLHNFGRHFGIY